MTEEKDVFTIRAQNIVNAVMATGKDSVPQVAMILKSVHQDAIEEVASDFASQASKALNQEVPNQERYNLYTGFVRHVRTLKNGRKNL